MRAIPSYYLRYFYLTERMVKEQGEHPTRASEVMQIEHDLLEMYRDPDLDVKPKLLEQRGGAFYSEAAAMLVESLQSDRGDTQVVNVRNDGAIPNIAADAVVEVPCRIDASGAHPLPQRPLPPEMLGLVEQVKAYERLTVRAAVTGRPRHRPAGADGKPARAQLRHRRAAPGRAARRSSGASAPVLRAHGVTVLAAAPQRSAD